VVSCLVNLLDIELVHATILARQFRRRYYFGSRVEGEGHFGLRGCYNCATCLMAEAD